MRTLFLPPTYQDSAESGRLILRDGSTAFIRPSQPGDLDALREFFHQLSPESKRRRFFSTADPAEALLGRQCDSSNPRSQLTLIVSRVVEGTSRIIATGSYCRARPDHRRSRLRSRRRVSGRRASEAFFSSGWRSWRRGTASSASGP